MNDYLLDTQAFIWFAENDPRLPARIKTLLEDENTNLFVNIASLWEITIKTSLNKLALSMTLPAIIEKVTKSGFLLLNIEPSYLITLAGLEYIHRDPFDRIIIASAITENMPLISSDSVFVDYPVRLLWT